MKTLIPLLFFILYGYTSKAQDATDVDFQTDHFIDSRDGKSYKIIKVESLWWFNENLNYITDESDCYKNDAANCKKYGRLYSYRESSAVCPERWRLPLDHELIALGKQFFGTARYDYWNLSMDWDAFLANDYLGFKWIPTGMKHRRKYKTLKSVNYWILAPPGSAGHLHVYAIRKSGPPTLFFIHDHEEHNPIRKKRKFGIRCVKPI